MSEGLLSLQWNNHKSTLHHMLSNVRRKECYADTTLACDGKLYPVHKLVLSMCSDYFEQIFANTQCKHPVIVLKDIKQDELECLLNYMYVGEVNVVQEKLSGLIKAAECLKIKGLAVPDEDPGKITSSRHHGSRTDKRTSDETYSGSDSKRRKYDSGSDNNKQINNYNSRNEESRRHNDRSRLRSDTSNTSDYSSNRNQSNSTRNSDVNASYEKAERGFSRTHAREKSTNSSQKPGSLSPEIVAEEQEEDIKAEEILDEPQPPTENDSLVIEEPVSDVKEEPVDDAVYLSDSNSVDAKGSLLESLSTDVGGGDTQMHFMEELLGQNPSTEHGHMGVGEYGDMVEGTGASTSRTGQQQQQMVGLSSRLTSSIKEGFSHHSSHSSSDHHHSYQQKQCVSDFHQQETFGSASIQKDTSESISSEVNMKKHTAIESELLGSSMSDSAGDITQYELAMPWYTRRNSLGSGEGEYEDIETRAQQCRRKYQCGACFKQFCSQADLNRHSMTHTGEKPFACILCSYKSIRKADIFRHMIARHKH